MEWAQQGNKVLQPQDHDYTKARLVHGLTKEIYPCRKTSILSNVPATSYVEKKMAAQGRQWLLSASVTCGYTKYKARLKVQYIVQVPGGMYSEEYE